MSDDESICGSTNTSSGEPCQNPAGSCPWDHGEENSNGRDFKLSEDDHSAILEAAHLGKSETGCARAAGVSWQSLERYLDAHPDFRSAFRRARAAGETSYIEGGRDSESDVDPSFAKFMLSSSYDYKNTEKREHEHSGDGGGPIEVVIGGDEQAHEQEHKQEHE